MTWRSLGFAILAAWGCAGPPADGDRAGETSATLALDPFAAVPAARRDTVRAFDVERLGGGRLRLADYRGRTVLLNIWASWCGPCRAEMPALTALAGELADSSFAFVTLSDDVDRAQAARFVAELGFASAVGFGDGRLRGRYYAFGLPATVLIDAAGRAMYRWSGYGGTSQLDAIRAMVRAERGRASPP
jgi:thiol-disulfide isomerase/thioredoxin